MEEKPASKQAWLQVIDLKGLKDGDAEQSRKLYESCVTSGCFYLDFQSCSDSGLVGFLDDMYNLVDSVFDLPLEEKLKYDADVIGDMKVCG